MFHASSNLLEWQGGHFGAGWPRFQVRSFSQGNAPIRTWCPIFTPDEPWKKPGVPYCPSNPGCLIEILMMVYHNPPKKHGQCNPLLYTLNNQGPFFLCSDGFPTTGILNFLEFATSKFWRKMPQVFRNEGKQHISISLSLSLSLQCAPAKSRFTLLFNKKSWKIK